MTTINMHMKFEIEIPKQTWLTSRKPCHLQSPETEKSNMAARRPFWNWRLKLIFKAKVKLESGNQKIQYGRQAAILKVTTLKINRLLPMATINMHMKFEIKIPKQTWLMLRKPCRLQTDRRTDGQTDRRTRWIQCTPPPTSLGRGIKIKHRSRHDSSFIQSGPESLGWVALWPLPILEITIFNKTRIIWNELWSVCGWWMIFTLQWPPFSDVD